MVCLASTGILCLASTGILCTDAVTKELDAAWTDMIVKDKNKMPG